MVDIALSLGNMRQLEKDIKKLQRLLKSDSFQTEVRDTLADEVKNIVSSNVANINDVDGNYIGTLPQRVFYVNYPYYRVMWSGKQVAYLEFGTGAEGVGKYPAPMTMFANRYSPDARKTEWYYKDARYGVTRSTGIAPQAPMYKSSLQMRMLMKGKRSRVHLLIKKTVDNALTAR